MIEKTSRDETQHPETDVSRLAGVRLNIRGGPGWTKRSEGSPGWVRRATF